MAIGDVIQVKLLGEYLGEAWVNVFYYLQTAGSANGAGACLNLFEEDVVPALLDTMVDTSAIIWLSAVNGMNNADQYERAPLSGYGQGVLDSITLGEAPSNMANGYRSNRGGIGTRYSYKRFAGMPLSWLDANGWDASASTPRAALAVALGSHPTGSGFSYSPVQVTGGFALGTPPTYTFVVDTWTPMDRPSTQNTRMKGRGA